ncbi:MAG: histidine kinase [Verrucomicrobia bacterium]|nr:histidine kinase [Verrucomicrobiota bacterium]
MVLQEKQLTILALVFALMALTLSARPGTTVVFREVMATYYAGTDEDLKRTIDGWEASPKGWSLEPQYEQAQAAIFIAEKPIEADLLNVTMFFMSGRPNTSFADFSISYTTDAHPGFQGAWHDLPMLNFGAVASDLRRGPGNHLIADEKLQVLTGKIPDDLYWISARTRGQSITGFRIEVFPVWLSAEAVPEPRMSWSMDKDFVLTEFRAEVISTTTNVALGAPVTATHRLWDEHGLMTADALTDGWPSTIAHPGDDMTGKDFHFEIDLGKEFAIDHLLLRQRGDNYSLDRFGKMRIRLYDQDPKEGATPTWQVLNRRDGSYPAQGEADDLRAADGQGEFHGRYLRISSESTVLLSPMLAEVEVYETRSARLVSVKADGQQLAGGPGVRIPPGVQRLAFQWEIPQSGQPHDWLYRWRVVGVSNDWQTSDTLLLEIPCPSPGDFQLELQAAHSDGAWDASVTRLAFTVDARFTQTPAFLWLLASGTLLSGLLVARHFFRKRITALQAETALTAERSRIARNMHDDVGARIAQLAVLQEIFAREHPMSLEAKSDLSALTTCAQEAMESLDEAVWTVNPRNDTLTALAAFLVQHADHNLTPLGIPCRIDGPNTWPEIVLRAGTRHEVALAFKEALQNIVKHAAATEVELTLRHETGLFSIRLADNGHGLPAGASGPGKDGLLNMRQRLESIGGTCDWLPGENGGTLVEMKLPLS